MDSWSFRDTVVGYRVEAPSPRGAVLLLHGYAEHVGRYTHVIEALVGEGLSVYAYDQRGHGRSGGPRALVRLSELVDDHLAAREWLRRELAGLPVFALGHSMGGLVTASSVLRDPRGLRGVVLSSPALMVGQDKPVWLRRAARVLARIAPTVVVDRRLDGLLSRDPQIDARWKQDPLCYQGHNRARTGYELMAGGLAIWSNLSRWSLPTLVVHGDADRLITIEGSRRFVHEIGSTDKELWEAPGGYHELFNDLESEAAVIRVRDWVTARL